MSSLYLSILSLLFLPPAPHQPPADRESLFKESYKQWLDYEKKTEGLLCLSTTKTLVDEKLTTETQAAGVLTPQGFFSVSRVTFPKDASEEAAVHSRTRPEVFLVRLKKDYAEVFNICTNTKAEEFADLNLATLTKKTGWMIRNENAARFDPQAYPGDYPARTNFKIHDGFRHAPGTVTLVEMLYTPHVTIKSVKTEGDKLIIQFTNDTSKSYIRNYTGGTITLLKNQNWLVSECELQTRSTGAWTTDKIVISMKYQTVAGVMVPASREEATHQSNKEGAKRVNKITTSYTISKLDDSKLMTLASFGIPEHELPAPAPRVALTAPEEPAPAPYIRGPEPFTSLDTIPNWAWITAGGVALLLVLVIMVLRPSKARA